MNEKTHKKTMKKNISPHSTMREVLEAYPEAQPALFQRYPIGGCNHCGFQPAEILAEVCRRNDVLNLDEVIKHIKNWHAQNGKTSATPEEFSSMPLPKSAAPCRTENSRKSRATKSYKVVVEWKQQETRKANDDLSQTQFEESL